MIKENIQETGRMGLGLWIEDARLLLKQSKITFCRETGIGSNTYYHILHCDRLVRIECYVRILSYCKEFLDEEDFNKLQTGFTNYLTERF